jgi:16S rRNA (guanine527-N7)-methyltransferase
MKSPWTAPIKSAADFARHFSVSRETLGRLQTYQALLKQWQKTINLVAPSTVESIWGRHFADSAQLLAYAPPGAERWLDLGSGAGFPGLVLAILLAEHGKGKVTLIESDHRKASFLGEAGRKTGVTVDIWPERIEKAPTQASVVSRETAARAGWDVITARALAPLPRLLDLAAPYFSQATVGLFLKGREAETEIEAARERWEFAARQHPSLTDSDGRIVVVSALKAKGRVDSR